MKKIGKQLNFIKELENADELEESLEPKDAKPSAADMSLNPQEVASEIEKYLNEEPDSDLNTESSDFKAQEPTPIISKEKAYWGKVHGESREEQARYDHLAKENTAKIKADLEVKPKPQAAKKSRPTDTPVSLIDTGDGDFSFDSDSSFEREDPWAETNPPIMSRLKEEATKKQAEQAAKDGAARDVKQRRRQYDGPFKV